jgi:hypothetical protein
MNYIKELIENEVRDIKRKHLWDKDIMQRELFKDLINFKNSLNNEEKEIFKNIMLEFVSNEDNELWYLALEYFVIDKRFDVFDDLIKIFNTSKSKDCKFQIILTIVKLGKIKSFNFLIFDIENNLINKNDYSYLQILFELCNKEQDLFIEIFSKFILSNKINFDLLSNYIDSLIYNILDNNEMILFELLKNIKEINYRKIFINIILEHLKKEWFIRKYGKEKINNIIKIVEGQNI